MSVRSLYQLHSVLRSSGLVKKRFESIYLTYFFFSKTDVMAYLCSKTSGSALVQLFDWEALVNRMGGTWEGGQWAGQLERRGGAVGRRGEMGCWRVEEGRGDRSSFVRCG